MNQISVIWWKIALGLLIALILGYRLGKGTNNTNENIIVPQEKEDTAVKEKAKVEINPDEEKK